MTSLEISTQQCPTNQTVVQTSTMNRPLVRWIIANVSVPSNNCTLNSTLQDSSLSLLGSIANEFVTSGESDLVGEVVGETDIAGEASIAGEAASESGSTSEAMITYTGGVYIAVDDITLTYCLPCNFDILNESGTHV